MLAISLQKAVFRWNSEVALLNACMRVCTRYWKIFPINPRTRRLMIRYLSTADTCFDSTVTVAVVIWGTKVCRYNWHSASSIGWPFPMLTYKYVFQIKYMQAILSNSVRTHTHTHTRLTALFPGLPGWAGTRKVKPIWILLKQETVSVSGISWAMCKSAPSSRQITTPAPHNSVFYRPDALPAAQPTALKHWMKRYQTALIWNL